MSTRVASAVPAREPIVIAAPPTLAEPATGHANLAMIVMPIISGSGSLLITMTNRDRPLFAAAGLIFLIASVGLGIVLLIGTRSSARRRQRENRERYLDYVEAMRHSLRRLANDQRSHAARRYPDPARLISVVTEGATPHAESPTDAGEHRLELRVGLGTRPIEPGVRLASGPGTSTAQYDPVCLTAARQLISRYQSVRDQPVRIRLDRVGVLAVVGPPGQIRTLARSVIAQIAVREVGVRRIAVVRTPTAAAWADLKWLPQCLDQRVQPSGAACLSTMDEIADMVPSASGEVLVILDHPDRATISGLRRLIPARSQGAGGLIAILLLDDPADGLEPGDARVISSGSHAVLTVPDEPELTFTPDRLSAPSLRALGRALHLARNRTRPEPSRRTERRQPLAEVLGTADVAKHDLVAAWSEGTERDFLRIPVGVGTAGEPIVLDLKESALGGNGPHGLVVGATGSGKSELLRTLVISLAIRNPPERLAFLLVDFKGGATFAGLAGIPHVAGMVTNLAEDHALVGRFRDALAGELRQRQQRLKDAGGLSNLREYIQRRTPDDEPLPHLLVMIDEFSELLTARPDFAELFSAVGRIGRSIGVHLLLATQRLDTARIRGLESHLSYRLALRTFSESESREVLGVADAYRLDSRPGSGYLKTADGGFEWFRSPTVSVAYEPHRAEPDRVPPVAIFDLAARTPRDRPASEVRTEHGAPAASGPESVIEVAARRIVESGARPARPVWLAPLPSLLGLGDVVEDARLTGDPDGVAVLGRIDVPAEQRQEPLTWDLSGSTANLVVVGAPRSGKTTTLRTLIGSLALRHSPDQVAFYCVDFGGGGLAALRRLPHLAVAAGRGERDLVRRAIGEVHDLLDQRERRLGTDPESTGRLVLVVDGWGGLRDLDPDLEEPLTEIATRGPALGVHTVLTITTSSQLRLRLGATFGARIELRLADGFESRLDRSAAALIPADVPGRALVADSRLAQVALPTLGPPTPDSTDDVEPLMDEVRRRWPGAGVPTLRSLPEKVDLSTVRRIGERDGADAPGVAIGLSGRGLEAARVDLCGEDPHLLVYGDPRTGKSTTLRVLLNQLVADRDPTELGIVLVDYRRSHLGAVPAEYLLAYCTSSTQTAHAATELAAGIKDRLPPSDVTVEQVRDRSWWRGREVVVVVDDYDLVATTSGNPLAPLSAVLAQGRELGLHLVLARRTGGAARFQFESVIQALNDLSSPGLLFSGDRTEGRLVGGVAPRRLAPGRALWVRRGVGIEQVQVAECPLT